MPIPVFMVERTDLFLLSLRRFKYTSEAVCPGTQGYHNAEVVLGKEEIPGSDLEGLLPQDVQALKDLTNDDPRWAQVAKCAACDYVFVETDGEWQRNSARLYRRPGTEELFTIRNAPTGAMWWNHWLPPDFFWSNKTDYHLMVQLPNGTDWNIDSRCNNCTLPEDKTHRCWVRTGEPPNIHVGKGGVTCAAGAGSIASCQGSPTMYFHGFLHNGQLLSLPDSVVQI